LKPDLDAARRKVGGNIEKNPLSETLFAAQGLSMTQTIKNQAFLQLREEWIKLVIEPKTAPTEEQILAFYEENFTHRDVPSSRDIYHILIKAESTDPAAKKAAARKKCAEILARVKAGEDFSELAKKFSDCPSKAKGGKLGIYEDDGSLVKEFTAVAFKMDEGAVSDVVETQFGYHIIKINKIIQAGRPPLDRVKPEIIEILSKKKANALIKQATEGVRQTMPININL
jgi:parvulin-like peptidyl-prolyl isomerase